MSRSRPSVRDSAEPAVQPYCSSRRAIDRVPTPRRSLSLDRDQALRPLETGERVIAAVNRSTVRRTGLRCPMPTTCPPVCADPMPLLLAGWPAGVSAVRPILAWTGLLRFLFRCGAPDLRGNAPSWSEVCAHDRVPRLRTRAPYRKEILVLYFMSSAYAEGNGALRSRSQQAVSVAQDTAKRSAK